MSAYDDLSPRARWYLENFDELALAEIAASHDTSRAAVLREAAALLRAAPSNGIGNDWNWWDAATIPDSCADALEAEADRLTEARPHMWCGDTPPVSLTGESLSPCILTFPHTQHQNIDGACWTLRNGLKTEHP